MFQLNIDNSFIRSLPADPDTSNRVRQVRNAAYSFVNPIHFSKPELIHVSPDAAAIIGLTTEEIKSRDFLEIFSGQRIYPNTQPYAMAYAGHQFGNWAGQLGDGRAINLFETVYEGRRMAIQLKGAGSTPYSRHADGLAVLRSSIREHLCSEAMYHLGIPTTRSLSVIKTGDQVIRDMFYDGHPAPEPGAVVCRLSPTFLRFGNFEFFAANKDEENLRKLLEYTIHEFYPDIDPSSDSAGLDFFREICHKTISLILEWQRVGFVHGVMNTDNMSAIGLTIDYGPYGWVDNYDEDWTPNTTDSSQRRYRFGRQDSVALWNLYQLANALYPVTGNADRLREILDETEKLIPAGYYSMMIKKLGIEDLDKESIDLVDRARKLLQDHETDMTIFFRNLSTLDTSTFRPDKTGLTNLIGEAFYSSPDGNGTVLTDWERWFVDYIARLKHENVPDIQRQNAMKSVNPKYVLRNYMAQMAIDAAHKEDYTLVEELFEMLRKPYEDQPEYDRWFARRPDWARAKAGCSMLSCSS